MASVAKRKWKSPDGTDNEAWIVRYLDRGGSNRQETFRRKKDADARRVQVEYDLATGEHIAKGQSRRIKDAAKLYLEDVHDAVLRGVLRQSTESNYSGVVHTWIIPKFGHMLATDLDTPMVEQWIRDIRRSNRLCGSAVRDRLMRLSAVMDTAIRNRWARSNPVLAVRREFRTAPRQAVKTFDLEQARALLKAASVRPANNHRRQHMIVQCYVALAAFCGLRWGEIAGLQRQHLDLQVGILRVRHTLNRFGNLQPPKTKAGVRDIRLPTNVAALLDAFLREFPAEPQALVFESHRRAASNQSSFRTHSWLPLLERAGLLDDDPFHFHALRHFAGSWMIENGWPLPDVSEALGHANVNITMMVYAHSIAKRSKSLDAVDAIAARLLGSVPIAQLPAPCAYEIA